MKKFQFILSVYTFIDINMVLATGTHHDPPHFLPRKRIYILELLLVTTPNFYNNQILFSNKNG